MEKQKLPKHFQTSAAIWDNIWHDPDIATPLKIPEQQKGKNFTIFSKKNAKKMESEIKKHIGEKVYVFGGGGNEADLAKLVGVSARNPEYYHYTNDPRYKELPKNAKIIKEDSKNHEITYTLPEDYIVEVTLKGKKDKWSGMWDSGIFTPHLGSWNLAFPKKKAKT